MNRFYLLLSLLTILLTGCSCMPCIEGNPCGRMVPKKAETVDTKPNLCGEQGIDYCRPDNYMY